MHLQLSTEQKDIRKAAQEFALGEFDASLCRQFDRLGRFPIEIWQKAAELGFVGMHFPESYLGGGLALMENVIVAQTLCQKDSSLGSALMLSICAADLILQFGTAKQKQEVLPAMADGKLLMGVAYLEASARGTKDSTTYAEKAGDTWVLNGEKAFVVNAGLAKRYCVLCRTAGGTEAGSSFFLVEAGQPGLVHVDTGEMLGLRTVATSGLKLKNVIISDKNLIGKEKQGTAQLAYYLNRWRVIIAACAMGTAQGAFRRALAYTKQRVLFGRKLAQFQVSRHKLAEMAVKIAQARHMTYFAAGCAENEKEFSMLAAMAKLVATRAALEVSAEAVQLLGGYGYMTEYDVERCYRDAKVMELIAGNSGCLKDLVAGDVIGRIG